jgi:FkbM family methyltransferase
MNYEFFYKNGLDKTIRDKFFYDYDYSGVLLEIGGGRPETLFSRHFFSAGWRCLIFEPNPEIASLQRAANNEIFEIAIDNEDSNDKLFTIVSSNDNNLTAEERLSSFKYNKNLNQKYGYLEDFLSQKLITVKTKKLDTFINILNLDIIDILYINTNGTELKVLESLSLLEPKIIILSDIFDEYNEHMINRGYELFLKDDSLHVYFLKEFYENK